MDALTNHLIRDGSTNLPNYLLANYTKIGMDANELLIYLQFKRFFDRGIAAPDIETIAEATGFDQQSFYQILHQLIQKKLMTIQTKKDRQGKDFDQYDFQLMYDKLAELCSNEDANGSGDDYAQMTTTMPDQANLTTNNDRKHVFESIEREFGRELSPIELETISQWLDTDGYRPDMIELALRESVLNQVYNLKYIDRILLNWEKKNIKTPNDVEKEIDRYENSRTPKRSWKRHDDGPEIPIFKIK
ncbi:DnaD domain-containing protein [Nicoliella lavandulae]|uniref:DnaD domain protein n=1 Tax=Nicoliella lavandulae TaxID=3082954 RepID=A0ABU8SL20_9LACO